MAVTKDKQVVLQGKRELMTGLWRVPLQIIYIPTNQNNNLHQVNGKENSIKYLHTAAFIPVQDTWAKVVNKGYFNTCMGLTAKDINKMTKFEDNIKGHLAQIRKNPDQQPTRALDKTRDTHIQSKNQITTR